MLDDARYFIRDHSARTFTLYAQESIFSKLDKQIIFDLEAKAISLDTNARICMHPKGDIYISEMIIAQLRHCFFPPKFHANKNKSFTVLSGQLGIYTFSIDGKLLDYAILKHGEIFYSYIKRGTVHVDIPITRSAVHLEIISGAPNKVDDHIFPSWYDPNHRLQFLDSLPTT